MSEGGFILVHTQNILLFIPCTVGAMVRTQLIPPRSDEMKAAKMKHCRRDQRVCTDCTLGRGEGRRGK